MWTLATSSDGALHVNVDGAPAGFTDWVAQLVEVGDEISHENTSGQWYAWTGTGWSAEADPTGACLAGASGGGETASCTELASTSGAIIDSAGNQWTLVDSGAGLAVDENGAAAAFTANVATLAYVGGVISHENTSGSWYAWTGADWSSEGDPTSACGGSGGTSTGPNGALFYDGFDSLDVSFDGSPTAWMDHYPFGGSEFTLPWNNEAEYLCDASHDGYQPFSISNGVLAITATQGAGNPKGLPWSSGTLTSATETNGEPSAGLFSHTYGYFEMRAKLPGGRGFWPAFVLYAESGPGEIDIFEVLGNDPSTLYFSLHATAGGGQQVVSIADSSAAFHTYGCDWQPDFITLYIDGVQRAQFATPSDMQGKPYYINIPFSVGGDGSWPGPTDSSTPNPGVFSIDYVGAWPSFAASRQ